MTLIGLDFDNTLVRYDKLFHQLAVEKNLIDASLPASKTIIRDYLRRQERINLPLAGEVYGSRILEAHPSEGSGSIDSIKESGVPMALISHKTKPFKGPIMTYIKPLFIGLKRWFFSSTGIAWNSSQIYFEKTKELKISRILSLRCTHYVDDLPEILSLLPDTVKAILMTLRFLFLQSSITI